MAIIFDTLSLQKENQRFFLNTEEVPGIQNINASYENNATHIKYLGGNDTQFLPVGPQVGKVSISNILISNDLWLNYTGESGVNGYIMKNFNDYTENFSFVSGYLSYYHSQCVINQLHKIDVTFDIFRNIGQLGIETISQFFELQAINNSKANLLFKFPTAATTEIILDDIGANKITSYDVAININRNPVYGIGSRYPIAVKTNYPIEVQCSFQIEVDSYSASRLNVFPLAPVYRNVSITTRDVYDNSTVLAYNFSGMLLVSEEYIPSVDNTVTVQATYKKLLNPYTNATDFSPPAEPVVPPPPQSTCPVNAFSPFSGPATTKYLKKTIVGTMSTVWHYLGGDDIISSGILSGYVELDTAGNVINNTMAYFILDRGDETTLNPGTYPIDISVNDLIGFGFVSTTQGFHAVPSTAFRSWAVDNIPETTVSSTLKTRIGTTTAPNELTNYGPADITIDYSLELSTPCTA